jgi:hypothetical protein
LRRYTIELKKDNINRVILMRQSFYKAKYPQSL